MQALGSEGAPRVRPESALDLLLEGNRNFASGHPRRPDQTVARRTELAKGQQPFAIVLTCADSRVAPELFFDQGLGDIFVLRNAGNVLDDHVIASMEYAVEHLGSGLIIVVGHSKCGAVAATVAGGKVPGHLPSIVQSIKPALTQVADQPGDKVDNTVRANAQLVADALQKCEPILSEAVAHGKLKVVAARYDLATGRVEVLPPLSSPTGHDGASQGKPEDKDSAKDQPAHDAAPAHAAEKPAAHGH